MRRVLMLVSCVAFGLAACGDDDTAGNDNVNDNTNENTAFCGNEIVEVGEQCDQGVANSDVAPDTCRTDCRSPHCGDGVVDPGNDEVCDGDNLAGQTCEDIGLGYTSGTLRCDSGCAFDTSDCATCGNDLREEGEECDGPDVGGQNCLDLAGLQEGIVTCTTDCHHDTSGCHACGNAVIEGPEDCEGDDLAGATCEDLGYAWGLLACQPDCYFDESNCHSVCGNGVAEPGEECDGADLAGLDCQTIGFYGGTLQCTDWCQLNEEQCTQCGDGLMDPGEECDGLDLGGQDCASLSGGSMTGPLVCTVDCHMDTSGCQAPATCGDGNQDAGEQCDGNDLAGQTCVSLNPAQFGGGTLACGPNCLFNTAGCTSIQHCGNGQAEPSLGEQCDGQDLEGESCQSLGFLGGTLACSTSCTFNTSACQAPLTCGNGVKEAGEACDGADLGSATCQSLGFVSGPLTCNTDCTYNSTACETCGDNVISGNDECDGADLGGQTCLTNGYYGGALSCQVDCTYDFTSCEAAGWCGDGIIQSADGESCDTTEFGTATCTDYGFDGGALTCNASCQVETTACATCGNGICEVGEQATCLQDCLFQILAAGGSHTCAVKADGTAWCWGNGSSGRLGDGSSTDRVTPAQVSGPGGTGILIDVVSISAGYEHTCAVKADGTAWCWGDNQYGRLGDGGTSNHDSPVQVLGPGGTGFLTDVVSISAGYYHTCAIKVDGTAWCWGANSDGQLGDGSTTPSSTPVQASGLTDVIDIATGGQSSGSHTCAVRSDGTAWCWGANSDGQLGDGTGNAHSLPMSVVVLTDAVSISAGNKHSCAVKTDGTAWCWGYNGNGQLGDGTTTGHPIPWPLPTLNNVAVITAGSYHTCAVKDDGTVLCWGYNNRGQLGDGTFVTSTIPLTVSSITGVTHVAAGSEHTCARLSDGSFRCWGNIQNGRLGHGFGAIESATPLEVQVGGLAISSVAAGSMYSCSVPVNGTTWCWGANNHGQLGDGTQVYSPTPLQVVGQGGGGIYHGRSEC
ncbi:RCC1 domain-containing protein [Myxococcota bacterium]